MRTILKRQQGFTLIELIVVIAILGVLAAIAVPVIANYLTQSKERAYDADQDKFQVAAQAYYSAPNNVRFRGDRQYPSLAKLNKGATNALQTSDSGFGPITGDGTGLESNPVGGTQGGTPWWQDHENDAFRDTEAGDDDLYYSGVTTTTVDHWNTTQVTLGSINYEVDSRDWLIDFDELVSEGLLRDVPSSASPDNDASATGAYSWYIDSDGNVQSLFYFLPLSSDTGYRDVYP